LAFGAGGADGGHFGIKTDVGSVEQLEQELAYH